MKYPFKFLDAYTKEDREIFFGRDEETEELYRMVFQTNLLLVYGGSGTGKTSLIRCGLANRFKAEQWLDLYIRRGADINHSLLESIQKHTPELMAAETTEEGLDWFENLVDAEGEARPAKGGNIISDHPVAQALEELYLATFTPIYLIFDQFEELYTLGNREEQEQFTATITELVQLPLPVKIIIVMREEYLARLYDLEMAVPQLRNKKLRIEPMDLPRVEQVILQATVHNPNSNVSLTAGRETDIARAIIENIREGDVNIKLPYLQVFMDRLYELASGEPTVRDLPVTIGWDLVQRAGSIGDVLSDFIERQNTRIHKELSQRYTSLPSDVIWRLLSPFATIDGTKVPIKEEQLRDLGQALPKDMVNVDQSFIRDVVAALENSRILRYRKEEQTYEVAHDTLAQQIADKRSEEEKAYLKARRIVTEGWATYTDTNTLLSKEQLVYIQPYEQRLQAELNPSQKSYIVDSYRRRKSQTLWIRLGVAAAFAAALLVIFVVVREQRKTQDAYDQLVAAQAAREQAELDKYLQDAVQIAKGDNCPPREMRAAMDSLYRKHENVAALKTRYEQTLMLLRDCD